MNAFVLHGDIAHAPTPEGAEFFADSFLVCADGRCRGIFKTLPERFAALPVLDFSGKLIIPGLSDLHTHASQYADLGLGMDFELIQWLDDLTFPEEARFADSTYAEKIYGAFVKALLRGFTTRAAIFATVHAPATLTLMRLLEESGLHTLVGKVNMDRNCPPYLCEAGAEGSIAETLRWLEGCRNLKNTKPIITPRFVPSCSDELLERLGGLVRERGLYVQSHLDETHAEIEWVRSLVPDSLDYSDVYDRVGLLTDKTVMAHCLYNNERETELIKTRGAFIAHCPSSNSNIRSGIAPVRRYLRQGVNIGLGTDISGGQSLEINEAMREALRVSKLRSRLMEEPDAALTGGEVFYLATRGGGAFFGDVGAFCEGFEFDAAVVDESGYGNFRDYSMTERLERFIFLSRAEDCCAKFVAGRRIF